MKILEWKSQKIRKSAFLVNTDNSLIQSILYFLMKLSVQSKLWDLKKAAGLLWVKEIKIFIYMAVEELKL